MKLKKSREHNFTLAAQEVYSRSNSKAIGDFVSSANSTVMVHGRSKDLFQKIFAIYFIVIESI